MSRQKPVGRPPHIYVHADDYGMTPITCQRIKECWEQGCLNSISILPNGCLEYAMGAKKEMEIPSSIHINLVEGKALIPAEQVNLLARPDGYMKNSFFDLLLLSISSKRKCFEEQLYLEIREQILSMRELFPREEPIFLDSHQHVHMIPLIFKTVLRVVKEYKIPVKYLRIPAEPMTPFFLKPSLYFSYRPINLVKNLVLNFLWLFNRKAFRDSGISSGLFCGIVFSGNMDKKRVMKVFPYFYKKAVKLGCDLEFLFHPGYIEKGDDFMDPYKTSFHQFYLSKGRKAEYKTLHEKEWCEIVEKENLKAKVWEESGEETIQKRFAL